MSRTIFNNKTFFKIYYCHNHQMYDFTVLDSSTEEVLFHYHYSNLKDINKLIQEFK